MSQENQITMRGYLTAEPKLYQKSPQAIPLTEIRIGCTPRRLNHETGEWYDLPTSYYRVKCWRRLAINTASSLHKGDQVFIRGRFYTNNWVDNQQRPRSSLEIEADTIGHDLAYGWSHYLRGRSAGNTSEVNAGEAARQDTGASGAEDNRAPGAESASSSGSQVDAGHADAAGDLPDDARDPQDVQEATGEAVPPAVDGADGDLGLRDAMDGFDVTSEASALGLEKEAVPL